LFTYAKIEYVSVRSYERIISSEKYIRYESSSLAAYSTHERFCRLRWQWHWVLLHTFFLSFFEIWSNFNKLKTPDQWLWTCRQCWVHNKTRKLCYRKDREPLRRYGHSKLSKTDNLFESKIAPLDPPSPKTLP